jgi:hypothetical protein
MPFVDTVEQALLNHFLTDPAYTPPATMYIALSSTTPTDAGANVTEPSGGSYARVSTVAADWGAATGTAPATKANTATKTFVQATADWVAGANLTHFVLFDALTVGNVVAWGALTVAKPVLNGDTPSFAVGALVLKLGKPTDTYT